MLALSLACARENIFTQQFFSDVVRPASARVSQADWAKHVAV